MNSLEITPCTNVEIEKVVQLGEIIWREHYSPIIGINQVNYMLEKFQSFEAIQTQSKEGYLYSLITLSGKCIGYFSTQPRGNSLFISKVYILKEYRGNGYFKIIMDHIAKFALKEKLDSLTLTVNKYNKDSIEIYLKKGFVIVESAIFDIGNGYIMDDYIMEWKF